MRSAGLVATIGGVLLMTNIAHGADALIGPTWRIDTVNGAVVSDPSKAKLVVDANGRVSTTVGCNQMSGMATIAGASLSFGPFASTRMACEPALMELEQRYGVALAATRAFKIDGKMLKFTDGAGRELITFTLVS